MTQPSGASVPRRIANPPVALIGWSIGRMTSWPGVSLGLGGDLRDRLAGHGRRGAVHQAALEELAHDETDPAGLVDVGGAVAAARAQVADERRARGHLVELVDIEGMLELGRDRQEVQDAVGRAAGRGDAGDRVVERGAGDEAAGPDIAPHEVHDELTAAPRRLVLAPRPRPGCRSGRPARGP